MAITIHCIRHGQGLHNVGAGFYELPDPKLTPNGEQQCLALRRSRFPDQSRISLILASPLIRALQSAYLIFQPALTSSDTPKTIIAVPDAQETSDDACDIGSEVQVLKDTCEQDNWPVDLSLVHGGWNDKSIGARYSPESKAIEVRARDLRLFLRQQARELSAAGDQDVHVALIAHGGFLHYLTGDWEDAAKFPATGWVNCETRAYAFECDVGDDTDQDAYLVELVYSREARGLNYPMISRDQQGQLFDLAMRGWENQGLQNPTTVGLNQADAHLPKQVQRELASTTPAATI